MKFRSTALLFVIVTALSAAASASGGNGGQSTTKTGTSSIAIASIDGTSLAAATVKPTPKLGDTLNFATTVAGLSGPEYPMVAVSCYQDVNGDGFVDTSLLGPDIVYSWLDTPSAGYTLGGYSSIWTDRGGGPAVCRADLVAISWKAGKESSRQLATTGRWAAAG